MSFILGLLTAWFSKKAVAFIDLAVSFGWAWWRAKPSLTCYAVTLAYTEFLQKTAKRIENGEFNDPQALEIFRRFDNWVFARLTRWQHRVRHLSAD